MANTEQIEAKLCAYVDGELDAGERAEIEQHLAANPQHRQLLDELMAQRQLLKELPREKAPVDLFDSFQTQLERSVLLDAKPPASHIAGRINPWPQIFSVAAVLLLAVGLFAVIYFVLPDQTKQLKDYAIIPSTTPADGSAAEASPSTVVDAGTSGRNETPREIAATGPTAIALGKGGFNGVYRLPRDNVFAEKGAAKPTDTYLNAVPDIFEAPPLEAEIAQRVNESPQVPHKSMLLVFACSDPSAADKCVTDYLAENSIRWDALAEPMPPPPAVRGEVYASKMQSRSYELRDAGNRPQAKAEQVQAQQPAGEYKKADKAKGDTPQKDAEGLERSVAEAAPPPPAPAAAPAPVSPPAPVAADQPPTTTAPARHDVFAQQQLAAVDAIKQSAGNQSSTAPSAITQSGAGQFANAQSQRFIVARGLTRAQVAELNSSIIAQNTGKLSNYYRSGSSITPTQPPLANSLATQVRLQAGSATQEIQRDRQVTESALGALSLKEGNAASTQPAQSALQTITTATVAPTTNATTQPLTALPVPAAIAPKDLTAAALDDKAPATTQPAAVAVAGAATAPTSAPAVEEERVDVVIVMKPDVVAEQVQLAEPPPTQPATTTPAEPQ